MKFARRMLGRLDSALQMRSSCALDVYVWLCRTLEWTDENLAHFPPVTGPMRVTMDAPGRSARLIQVYEGSQLLVAVDREPDLNATSPSDHSLYSTSTRFRRKPRSSVHKRVITTACFSGHSKSRVRCEWRCRVAGERRSLAEMLMGFISGEATKIMTRYGEPYIMYAQRPDRPADSAMLELMTNQDVNKSVQQFQQCVDRSKIEPILAPR